MNHICKYKPKETGLKCLLCGEMFTMGADTKDNTMPVPMEARVINLTQELKARMSLLDPDFLVSMAKVMDFGTRKYSEEDWRDNPAVTVKKRMDSLGRHEAKINSATESDIDSDHGESHFASIAVNAMICWWICKNRPERDDRYKGPKK